MRYTSATTEVPGLAAVTLICTTSPGRTISKFSARATENCGSGLPHDSLGEVVLRGAGEPVVKSARLLSVSAQPPSRRNRAVVLLVAGPEAPSKKLVSPHRRDPRSSRAGPTSKG
jgi:hypothetical protein